jgi:hypothetical protein
MFLNLDIKFTARKRSKNTKTKTLLNETHRHQERLYFMAGS